MIAHRSQPSMYLDIPRVVPTSFPASIKITQTERTLGGRSKSGVGLQHHWLGQEVVFSEIARGHPDGLSRRQHHLALLQDTQRKATLSPNCLIWRSQLWDLNAPK